MSAADMADERHDLNRDPRVEAARLALVVDSLSATVLFNPLGTLMVSLTLYRGQQVFGAVVESRLIAAVALQAVAGAVAFWMQRRFKRQTAADPQRLERALIVLQVYLSACWGAVFWLLWCDGNAANNLLLTLLMVCVVWSSAFMRSPCPRIFLSGTAVACLAVAARYLTAHGLLAFILLTHIPFWIAYIVIMSRLGKRRVDEALIARFANEDLGEALRKARDAALEQRWEAEAANAAKTAFLANMSHELRTPLNAILGFSDIIAAQSLGADAERYADYANDIHSSGAHLLSLINDLLDVAKIEAGKMEIDPQPLDPAHTLAEVERLMAPRALAKRQHLTFPQPGATPWLNADERAFKQIALNLVCNALKFTPEDGHIDVRCERGHGGFVLSVADDGPGIPRAKQAKVFQAFAQVDNRYDRKAGGTGLGLALVQGLARLHGGRAWIDSEEGRGTTVSVYFPLAIDAPARAPSLRGALSKF